MIVQNTIFVSLMAAALFSLVGIFFGNMVVRAILPRDPIQNDEQFRHGMRSRLEKVIRNYLEGPALHRELNREFVRESELLSQLSPMNVQYAIGLGLISKEDVASIENGSLAQSNLALGMIFPLSLLMCSLASRLRVGQFEYLVIGIGVVFATAALFFVGMDRRYRYRSDLRALIIGRWLKSKLEETPGKTEAQRPTPAL
jgi:hypothetical protein